jgi:hypothetical protein
MQQLHDGGVGIQVSSPPLFAQMKSPRHAISKIPEHVENVEGRKIGMWALSTVVGVPLTHAAVPVCRTAVLPLELHLPGFSLLSSAPTRLSGAKGAGTGALM